MNKPPVDLIQSSRAEQRKLRLEEIEREQHAEDLEALKITDEQLRLLEQPFSAVKFEFHDLDGLRWTNSSLYTRQYRAPVASRHYQHQQRHHNPLPSSSTATVLSKSELARFNSTASDETIRVPKRSRKAHSPIYPSSYASSSSSSSSSAPHPSPSSSSPSAYPSTASATASSPTTTSPASPDTLFTHPPPSPSSPTKHRHPTKDKAPCSPLKGLFSPHSNNAMRQVDMNIDFRAGEGMGYTVVGENISGMGLGLGLSKGTGGGMMYTSPDLGYEDMFQDNAFYTCPPSPCATPTKAFKCFGSAGY